MSVRSDLVARIPELAPSVVVIGDVILDGWWHGSIDRVSREAPAPVVEVAERIHRPGGAANTAVSAAALGARVAIVGVVGDDEAGRMLRRLLDEAGVDTRALLVEPSVCTTTKTRIGAADQIVLRVDDLPQSPPSPGLQARLAVAAVEAAGAADAEIISDYGTGALTERVLGALAGRSTRPALSVVDAHDPSRLAVLEPDLITPNAEEFARVTGSRPTGDRAAAVRSLAATLLERCRAAAAVVTLDRDGTVLLDGEDDGYRTFANPTSERHASGAGDTFVAALTVARAAGASLPEAADLAQLAADIVVDRPGTSVCTSNDLLARLAPPENPSLGLEELERALEADRRAGRRIVFTNGCFDVLHRGHTSSLRQAKQLGGVLVVAINDDESVCRLKGPGRPANTAADRAAVLGSLECVDYVTVFSEDTPIRLIERLRPDVYAKGGDYTPEMLEESRVVASYGGEVRILDYVPEHSTTEIMKRIRAAPSRVES